MKFVTSCCFCGRAVKKSKTDPCNLYISPRRGPGQTFWPHAACFKKALGKAFRDDLMEELGGPTINWTKMRPVPDHKLPPFLRRKIQKVADETQNI